MPSAIVEIFKLTVPKGCGLRFLCAAVWVGEPAQAGKARMPEGERPKRIRKMRHRAFTKRQGRLKVSAQSVARCHANKALTKRQGCRIVNAQRLCTDAKPTKQTTRTPATFCKRRTKTFGFAPLNLPLKPAVSISYQRYCLFKGGTAPA